MLEKSRNAAFLQWFVCRVRRKVGLLMRRVRRRVVRGQLQNCAPLWRIARFEVKMHKRPQVRNTFCSLDVEKLHAALARSTSWSQNVQNTAGPEQFLKFWCRKIARRCSAKHICKSKCTKHRRSEAVFEVLMSKKLHAAVAPSTFASQNVQKTYGLRALFEVWMSKNGVPL